MSEEINYDRLSYDELLRFAKGSARVLIPKLCAALKRENPHYSNYDIREIVTKDCISIWQRATIANSLPDEYKDPVKAESGTKGRQSQLEQQAGGLVIEGESGKNNGDPSQSGNISPTNLWAESGSAGPIEDVSDSEDFSKMNRGQDVITEKERAKMLSKQLEEVDSERSMLRSEIADLKNQVKTLSEKSSPELLKEIEEKFADDQKGIMDSKKLQKVIWKRVKT